MEPTTVMISTIVVYLAKKLKDNKSINNIFDDFTEATVNWLKPIFLKEGQPKEVLENLQSDPSDDLNQKDAVNAIERALRQNPAAEIYLKDIYYNISTYNSFNNTINKSNNIIHYDQKVGSINISKGKIIK